MGSTGNLSPDMFSTSRPDRFVKAFPMPRARRVRRHNRKWSRCGGIGGRSDAGAGDLWAALAASLNPIGLPYFSLAKLGLRVAGNHEIGQQYADARGAVRSTLAPGK
jgi:hypothetical protein